VLRLPGPSHTLALDPAEPAKWDEQVRTFFAENLRANGKWVRVQRRGGGRSKAVVYQVWVDGSEVGTFKLFEGGKEAATEAKMLKMLGEAKLAHMTPVRERGTISVKGQHGSAILMDSAPGTSVKQMIEALPASGPERDIQFAELKVAVGKVATGLAEMHAHFEGGGLMTKENKLEDANWFLDKAFREGHLVAKVRAALGETDFRRVKARVEGPILNAFLAAKVPATAYHGDANAGNFVMNTDKTKPVDVIDVGAMSFSVNDAGRGTKTGAADVARFLGSLETLQPGALAPDELGTLRTAFLKTYFKTSSNTRRIDRDAYAAAEVWYRIELQAVVVANDPSQKLKLLELVGLERP
jgi:hypothetical protein